MTMQSLVCPAPQANKSSPAEIPIGPVSRALQAVDAVAARALRKLREAGTKLAAELREVSR
jgi:hypothetical protein